MTFAHSYLVNHAVSVYLLVGAFSWAPVKNWYIWVFSCPETGLVLCGSLLGCCSAAHLVCSVCRGCALYSYCREHPAQAPPDITSVWLPPNRLWGTEGLRSAVSCSRFDCKTKLNDFPLLLTPKQVFNFWSMCWDCLVLFGSGI